MMTTKVMAGVDWRFLYNYWFAWFFIMVDTELLLLAHSVSEHYLAHTAQ